MTDVKDSKYLKVGYFQKSKILFALIAGEKYYLDNKDKIINTYLFSTELQESILDYYLMAEFSEEARLDEKLNHYIYSVYTTENNTKLYIFDISDFSVDVDKFLVGNYSEFSSSSKDKILHYYGYYRKDANDNIVKYKDVHSLSGMLHFYTFLYPEDSKPYIAEEMASFLFGTKEEALKVLKEMKELCLPYDMEEETINVALK